MRLCSVILFYRRYFKSLRFPSNQFDYVKFETGETQRSNICFSKLAFYRSFCDIVVWVDRAAGSFKHLPS